MNGVVSTYVPNSPGKETLSRAKRHTLGGKHEQFSEEFAKWRINMTNLMAESSDLPTLYTVEDVAAYLQISLSKAYQMVRDGSLPSVSLGRCVRVKASDLAEYLRRSTRYEFEG